MHPGVSSQPSVPAVQTNKGLSTKQKVIIGSIIGAAAAAAIIACAKHGCGSGGGAGAGEAAGVLPTEPALLLFGGHNHAVFLGCLNCSQFDAGSVFNQYGEHGSPYADASIFNKYGEFGSPYSGESACNQFASDPPIIVDRAGNAYGRLTLNKYAYQVKNPTIIGWLAAVCSN